MPRGFRGAAPCLATGVRIPEIVIPPVLRAHKAAGSTPTTMLSYHRETAPARYIESEASFLRGHTGTSIREYIEKSLEYSEKEGVPVQVEADHVSITPSPEKAVARITHGVYGGPVSREEAERSLEFIREELEEARDSGGIDVVTIDTTELVDLSVEGLGREELLGLYRERLEGGERRGLEALYLGRAFEYPGDGVYIRYREEDLARLYLKFSLSIEYATRIAGLVKELFPGGRVGLEVALDELPWITSPMELHFYLNELARRGVRVDYIAPNIGFKKREDYSGDLEDLERRVRELHTVARAHGALLSLHSGSGAHPYSDKGPGVWGALRRSTGGKVKYKVSGVYIQLLLEVMSGFPRGSGPRRLYEDIYDSVIESLWDQVESGGPLGGPQLRSMLEDYERVARRGRPYDPRSAVFRHYFFLFQAIRDDRGRRRLREELLSLYREDEGLRRSYVKEASELTLRMLRSLGIAG